MASERKKKYNEENVRYESAIVLPGSRFKKFSESGSVVNYKGVDVYVFSSEQDAKDWMDEMLKSYFWNNREKLIRKCKEIAGPSFRYARYVDMESLMKHLVKHYSDSSVVPKTFRSRFKSDEEGKKFIYDDVIGAARMMTNAEYRLSLLLFDFVDMDSLVNDLEEHLGLRVFKQGSFYYVIDLYPKVL